jgi:hypothetical protein
MTYKVNGGILIQLSEDGSKAIFAHCDGHKYLVLESLRLDGDC